MQRFLEMAIILHSPQHTVLEVLLILFWDYLPKEVNHSGPLILAFVDSFLLIKLLSGGVRLIVGRGRRFLLLLLGWNLSRKCSV